METSYGHDAAESQLMPQYNTAGNSVKGAATVEDTMESIHRKVGQTGEEVKNNPEDPAAGGGYGRNAFGAGESMRPEPAQTDKVMAEDAMKAALKQAPLPGNHGAARLRGLECYAYDGRNAFGAKPGWDVD